MDSVTNTQPITMTENGMVKPTRKSLSPLMIVLIVVGAIALLIAGIVTFVNSAAAAPLKVSNEFLEAMVSSDPETAYYSASDAFREDTSLEAFEYFIERNSEAPFDEAKVVSKYVGVTNSVETATFGYEMEFQSETYTFETKLIKEDGEWKMLSLEID